MNNPVVKKEYISSGYYGDVYKLINEATNQVFALKIFKNVLDQRGIKNEINSLCKLQHPHIVKIYGCCTPGEKQDAMVMEFCPTDLRKAINQGIPTSRAYRLFTEILKGFDFIHKQNLVHNDLKPENILLDSKNAIKISDFGLVRYCNRSQCQGPNRGRSSYMPPEAVQHRSPVISSKTDMYSIGVITFEMFVNPNTFRSVIESLRANPQKVAKEQLENKSPMRYEIITQLLSERAEGRPSAGTLLRHLNIANQYPTHQQNCSSEWWRAIGAKREGNAIVLKGIKPWDLHLKR